jgi:hypothetical protein
MNGVAERNIRTLVEMVRAMLIQSNAPRRLCGEAFMYATYVLNTMPARSGKDESRLDLWYERKEERHLRIRPFGCAAWILNVKPQQDKLASKGELCILVGYDHLSHCYRLATFPRFQIVRSAHVTFNETLFPCGEQKGTNIHPDLQGNVTAEPLAENGLGITESESRRSSRGWQPSAEALNNIINQVHFADAFDWTRGEVLWDKYE